MSEPKYPIECFGCRYHHGELNCELCPPCDCKERFDLGRRCIRSMAEKMRKRMETP
jgi:hypothetical protein